MPVVAYPETAVIDVHQLCQWLGISKRQVERQGFPCFYLGTRTRRYSVRQVLEFLEKRAA